MEEAVGSGRACRVVVVDDDAATRQVLADILDEAGYDVRTADGGLAALRAFDRPPPPDFVLLDVAMPDLDGIHVMHAITGRDDLAEIPIVLMTAGARPESPVPSRAIAIGKPDELASVLGAAVSMLRRRGPARPATEPRGLRELVRAVVRVRAAAR